MPGGFPGGCPGDFKNTLKKNHALAQSLLSRAQIHNIRQLTSADVRYESEHFLPPRKKLAHIVIPLVDVGFPTCSVLRLLSSSHM
jgi:hypothetical protein